MKKIALLFIINILFGFVNSYGMHSFAEEHLQEIFIGKENIRVITITRKNNSYGYGKLDLGEINLVFAQLACCMNDPKAIYDVLVSRTKDSPLHKDILKKYEENMGKQPLTSHNMTVILFNEMFFGKDSALAKSDIDYIISSYQAFCKFLPNTFLHINFLYKDVSSRAYEIQFKESREVYKEIKTGEYPFSFINFIDVYECEEKYEEENKKRNDALCKEYIEKILASKIAPTLLLNQTKIFFGGQEIGFYNKSSHYLEAIAEFMDETRTTLRADFPFYVIGNFASHYSEFLDLSPSWEHVAACKMWMNNVTNLICYDIDAIENNVPYKRKAKDVVLFASNSHYGVLAGITGNPSTYITGERLPAKSFICADPEGVELAESVKGKDEKILSEEEAITGIFRMNSKNIFPIDPIKALSSLNFSFGPNEYIIDVYDLNLIK